MTSFLNQIIKLPSGEFANVELTANIYREAHRGQEVFWIENIEFDTFKYSDKEIASIKNFIRENYEKLDDKLIANLKKELNENYEI